MNNIKLIDYAKEMSPHFVFLVLLFSLYKIYLECTLNSYSWQKIITLFFSRNYMYVDMSWSIIGMALVFITYILIRSCIDDYKQKNY
jgi:hypothetical protein